ncbi:hypothetical protein CHS0354_039552 [Potamilus streckersoni]|uniref:Matrix-remodeling-associated protein 7 helical domain-containing protein n=1 Tax=Potamilus streckersoni TaxID=2493646 RepID=A0AAE0WF80_9BIVA|nr:hypothetical protein CHS0354_039552 [Potamilus streckersoni]
MDFLTENTFSVYGTSMIITVVALVVASLYALSNIFKLWEAGKPKPAESEIDESSETECDDEKPQSHVKESKESKDYESVDPVEYCEHIQSEVKKAQLRVTNKKLEQSLTEEQLKDEREIQRKQLEEIFKLIKDQNDKFGISSIDDIQEQMKLYA